MFLEYTPEQQALRKELREYFAQLLTQEVRDELGEPGEGSELFRTLVQQMGKDGWLGIGWPKEFGGQGRPATDQFIFFDEVQRAGAPFPFVTLNTVGPTIMRFGSEEQKAFFLPGILAGEINFAIGYTEPEAGTDLASLRTRAVLDGDEWVVNGNKVFTSGANQADYVWLACRTDPDAPKHKGISILVVPTASPGFKCTPIVTVGGNTTTATFYDDVCVPKHNIVGDVNAGWQLITTQLNHERVGLAAMGGLAHRLWDEVLDWCRATDSAEGGRMLDVPWVHMDLARAHARLEAMKLLNWRMAAALDAGALAPADSSAVKVYGTETLVDVYRTLLGILGAAGYLAPGSPGAALNGDVERAGRAAQINTFGGGVNEVQREIIASAGLGMARRAR
jgi:3-oxocholest-4-en-26-oyl-CoA dehydrogenase alpha subunit